MRVPVLVVWTDQPAPVGPLTALECAQMSVLAGSERRRQWLMSRHALRVLLGLLGLPRDTAARGFPHPRLSLAHADCGAIAAGSVRPRSAGLGVDLEPDRPVDPRTARFFLDDAEQAWLARMPRADRAAERLRLWTVKEAVFKADLANRDAMLSDYTTQPPGARAGQARRRGTGQLFGFTSARFQGAHLSVAAARGPAVLDPVDRRTTMPVTFECVAERISQTLNVPTATLTPKTTLRELAADSFLLVEMAVDLQEEFDVIFTQADLREVANLGQLVDLLHGPKPPSRGEPDG
jgi:acyl carrier protein/4'-phosphopantetheinyl transferase EntD